MNRNKEEAQRYDPEKEREDREKDISPEDRKHMAPPPHEPRVGEDYRHHPHPVPGVDMPGEVPGDDLESGGRKDGMGYNHGSADGRAGEHLLGSNDTER